MTLVHNTPTGFNEFKKILPNTVIQQLVIGKYWTLVGTKCGTGLATSPPKERQSINAKPKETRFLGQATNKIIELSKSINPYERAIGCATINSLINKHSLQLPLENGLDISSEDKDHVVVIGRFPGLDKKLPNAIVLEMNPGPNDFPASKAKELIPGCDYLIITASSWVNGSLQGILDLANGAHVSLIGPSTPLSPILNLYGIHKAAGFIAEAPAELASVIRNGGGAKQFKHLGKYGVMDFNKKI
ncbi:MAG: hypothetical protein CMM58_05865 [Rhodospirillaceae bacterium]|nr:hypothetical protein [Rhodospirillaceae bacterium]|tara:strand:+ start:1803 stop:2537 length:735 start_codon:yes stop_codon:yes gene_type:complete